MSIGSNRNHETNSRFRITHTGTGPRKICPASLRSYNQEGIPSVLEWYKIQEPAVSKAPLVYEFNLPLSGE
jgi:hypothetical protein